MQPKLLVNKNILLLPCLTICISLLSACSTMPANNKQVLSPEVTAQTINNAIIHNSSLPQMISEQAALTFSLPNPQKFNLNLRNAPIQVVLETIFESSDINIVFAAPIQRNITLRLRNVTALDVLNNLRLIHSIDYEMQGNTLIIRDNSMQTRVFNVNHPIGTRQGMSELTINSGSLVGNSGTQGGGAANQPQQQSNQDSARLTTQTSSNFWQEIETVIKSMVRSNPKASVVVSPQTNTLVVSALASELQVIENYLSTVKSNIKRQVMIEAKIIEVRLSQGQQTGINWSLFHGNRASIGFTMPGTNLNNNSTLNAGGVSSNPGFDLINAAANAPMGLLSFVFQNNSFAAVLNFLRTQGGLQVLSSPRIATTNNQKAVLKVGTDEFFVTNITSTQTSNNSGTITQPSLTTQPFFSGISLDITPQIADNGMVTMHVRPSVSSVNTVTRTIDLGQQGTYVLPLAASSIAETDSVVRIPNNAIVAIGGLMSSRSQRIQAGIPGVSELPTIGSAFRNNQDFSEKYELVILLRPTIIENLASWQQQLQETHNRLTQVSPKARDINIILDQSPQGVQQIKR